MRHNYVEDNNYTDDMPFGEFLRKKRRLSGMTQTDFSKLIGVTKDTISKWELGVTSPPIEDARYIVSRFGAELLIVNKGER